MQHSYAPRTSVLQAGSDGRLQQVAVQPGVFAAEGVIVYRFEANLFYANAGRFMDDVIALAENSSAALRWIVIDATGINDIDYSAAKALIQLDGELRRRHIGLACVATSSGVLAEIRRYSQRSAGQGLQRIFESVGAALQTLAPPFELKG